MRVDALCRRLVPLCLLAACAVTAAAESVRVQCFFGYQVVSEGPRRAAAALAARLEQGLVAEGWRLAGAEDPAARIMLTVIIGRRHAADGQPRLRHAVIVEHSARPRLWHEEAATMPAPYRAERARRLLHDQIRAGLAAAGLAGTGRR